MANQIEKALRGWLRAEREGDPARAERLLAAALGALPLARASAGFADRVVAATDLRLEPRLDPRPIPWWGRAAVAASLLLGALGLLLVVPTFLGALRLFDPAGVITGGVAALQTVVHRLADFGMFWDLAIRLREGLLTVVAIPQVSLLLLSLLAVSSLALRGLTELLSPHRRPAHVTP